MGPLLGNITKWSENFRLDVYGIYALHFLLSNMILFYKKIPK